MTKVSDIFIQNIKNLPIWVKQVISKEVLEDIEERLNEFRNLVDDENLFQYLTMKVTFKGKQELQQRAMELSEGYYAFLSDAQDGNNIFEITVKNNWTLADTSKIYTRLCDLEFIVSKDDIGNKKLAVALFIAGKIKTGEFLKKIGKINTEQLEHAIRFQKELNDEGRHIKMASILIKLGFISDKGLDSLLLLKEESRKRLPINAIFQNNVASNMSKEEETNQINSLRKELSRLENENLIMKKRLKKLLNL